MRKNIKVIRCPIKFEAGRCSCVGGQYKCTNAVLSHVKD